MSVWVGARSTSGGGVKEDDALPGVVGTLDEALELAVLDELVTWPWPRTADVHAVNATAARTTAGRNDRTARR
jgi:hypothetical protein